MNMTDGEVDQGHGATPNLTNAPTGGAENEQAKAEKDQAVNISNDVHEPNPSSELEPEHEPVDSACKTKGTKAQAGHSQACSLKVCRTLYSILLCWFLIIDTRKRNFIDYPHWAGMWCASWVISQSSPDSLHCELQYLQDDNVSDGCVGPGGQEAVEQRSPAMVDPANEDGHSEDDPMKLPPYGTEVTVLSIHVSLHLYQYACPRAC